MATKKPHEAPFFVRQAGLVYGPEMGAVLGYDTMAAAEEDVAGRNAKAESMGLKARYEAVENTPAE